MYCCSLSNRCVRLSELLLLGSIFIFSAIVTAADNNGADVSIPEAWGSSPHADVNSESFTHWNEKGEIPAECATCHSATGFQEYLGADGSAAGVIDSSHKTGSVVDCDTCHNDAAKNLTSVTFPSGIRIENLQASAQCLVCHQGRSSTQAVNQKLMGLPQDVESSDLTFINVHYRAAGATLYGSEAGGGYEYDGKTYVGRFAHVAPFNTCTGCHDVHSLSVDAAKCVACHQSDSLLSIRHTGTDYDGDGDVMEGIAAEIDSLQKALLVTIVRYSVQVIDAPVLYSAVRYPYFFNDSNADGIAGESEISFPNRYQSWTPRLLRAAYNYQFVAKDPGGYAHNPSYVLQLLFDSLESLSSKVATDVGKLTRP